MTIQINRCDRFSDPYQFPWRGNMSMSIFILSKSCGPSKGRDCPHFGHKMMTGTSTLAGVELCGNVLRLNSTPN